MNAELCLGTAQFGMEYGIANRHGVPGPDDVVRIVEHAYRRGVRWFDTAQCYGRSERVLGRAFRKLGIAADVQVVSKLDPGIDPCNETAVEDAIRRSLAQLGVPRLAALLVHRPAALDCWEHGLGAAIRRALDRQRVGAFGVSVYRTDELRQACTIDEVRAFQCPLNALDRRFATPSLFPAGGMRFYRSVYLQGLLLLDEDHVAERLPHALPAVRRVQRHCAGTGVELKPFLVGCAVTGEVEGRPVIGVETLEQLDENLTLLQRAESPEIRGAVASWLEQELEFCETLINPSLWRTHA